MYIFNYQKMETIISTCKIVAKDFEDAEKQVQSSKVIWHPKDHRIEYDMYLTEDIKDNK
tara:strand:- start:346 stop:522 length:177 start_codon:yes stop_codon:yes gene_type:complete